MCKRFGEIDDCRIYYDRQTKKHLGLGTVRFYWKQKQKPFFFKFYFR